MLFGLKRRGLEIPPRLALGEGALGFWAGLSELYPQRRHRRCCQHKTANALNYLPRALHSPRPGAALHEIWMAKTRADANRAFERFIAAFGAKSPKALECLAKDRTELLAFYELPAEHCMHLRTTDPIESSFATVRHRTDRTKACLSRDAMLAMILKLGIAAERAASGCAAFTGSPKRSRQ